MLGRGKARSTDTERRRKRESVGLMKKGAGKEEESEQGLGREWGRETPAETAQIERKSGREGEGEPRKGPGAVSMGQGTGQIEKASGVLVQSAQCTSTCSYTQSPFHNLNT